MVLQWCQIAVGSLEPLLLNGVLLEADTILQISMVICEILCHG